MDKEERPQVFISYAKEDAKRVHRLNRDLSARGVNTWIDEEKLNPGRWKGQIRRAITKSRYFLFCISESALRKTKDGSGFIDDELQYAYEIATDHDDRHFTIIPIRLDDCGHGDLRLSGFQQYKFFSEWESSLGKLAGLLGGDERSEEEVEIERLHGKADAYLLAGDWEKMLLTLDLIISHDSNDGMAWALKGLVLGENGQIKKAIKAYKKAEAKSKDCTVLWYQMGLLLMRDGKHKKALKSFKKAIHNKPTFIDDIFSWGEFSVKHKLYEDALLAFNAVIDLERGYTQAWKEKVEVLIKLAKYEEALSVSRELKRISPNDAIDGITVGGLLAVTGRYKELVELNSFLFGATDSQGGN